MYFDMTAVLLISLDADDVALTNEAWNGMPLLVERSLLEQMKLDTIEIERRKELLNFTDADCAALLKARPIILPEIESIVEEFYVKQVAIEEIAVIIGDRETMRRLRIAQKQYIDDLFSGVYDEEYVNNRLRIGLVHKRIGLEPKYYISAIKGLKDSLRSIIRRKLSDRVMVAAVMEALDKLMSLDTEFVFDTYIRSMLSEIQAAKDKALRYAVSLEQKVDERTRDLARLSRVDSLTGILNRRAFFEDFRKELTRAKRASAELAVIYLDIDCFKEINDSQGHRRGDELLIGLANALKECVRETDILGRLGGDEFCLVLGGVNAEGAEHFCERLTQRLDADGLGILLSLGIATSGPKDFEEPEVLVDIADQRMYAHKSVHRGASGENGKGMSPATHERSGKDSGNPGDARSEKPHA